MATVLTATPKGCALIYVATLKSDYNAGHPGRINKSRRASLFGERSPYVRYHRAPPAVIGD